MKIKLLYFYICLIAFASLSFAQPEEARKISDLSRYNCEELKIHSFDFRDELTKEDGAKGFVIVYEGKDQTSVYDKNSHFQKKCVCFTYIWSNKFTDKRNTGNVKLCECAKCVTPSSKDYQWRLS